MASTYLSRTVSTSTDNTKFTISVWVKKAKQVSSDYQCIINSRQISSTGGLGLFFGNNDNLFFIFGTSASASADVKSNSVYRDNSAWYHIVATGDASQTGTDKLKFWVNGEQITSFATDNRSSFATIEYDLGDATYPTIIGRKYNGTYQIEGSMAHFHFIDGTAYDADTFGQTDATTGIWKPKTAPSVTYGTNGFFLKFENSGAFGTDSSGNGNNFTVNGTMTQTLDTPSNVFATMNPLRNYTSNPTYSLGNLKITSGSGNWTGSAATLAVSQGKWYWEVKLTGTMTSHFIGVQSINGNANTATPMWITGSTTFYNHDGGKMYYDNSAQAGTYGVFSSGDIMGLALDMDAGTYGQITIYKNGVALVSDFDLASTTSDTIYPFMANNGSTQEINFGNGFFGTTAVSSAQNPDDGIGIFEYDVPAGYRALCTKSINAEEYS